MNPSHFFFFPQQTRFFLSQFSNRITSFSRTRTASSSAFLPFRRSLFTSPLVTMPRNRGKQRQQWREKHEETAQAVSSPSASDQISEGLSYISLSEAASQSFPESPTQFTGTPTRRDKEIWVPKAGYATSASTVAVERKKEPVVSPVKLTELFKGPLGADFNEDGNTFARAQIRATFYPKFENEKSDQEIRTRMIEMVSQGLATLEVSLKHSGSLFMYAGHEGGAYAKNSFGNIYTAVGVFVLGRMFREAWGKEAPRMQGEFNDFLEKNCMCISMELVTAVLGDHGQRPKDDYAVVTAVTELGVGKPKFFSTPEIIAFCRKWRLPTNHVWLFSTRKSATALFAAYDALCEEGTATTVCKALDEVADISIPGSKDHIKVQGEILEGLVARIVSRDSLVHMENVLREFPPPPLDGVDEDLGSSLRDVCASNRSAEKEQIKALLDGVGTSMCPTQSDWFGVGDFGGSQFRNVDRSVLTKFLHVHPTDYSTMKLQELIRLMRQRRFQAAFKCYTNFHKINDLSKDNLYYKMVIHVHSDHVFRKYQQEMRKNKGLWPLYRGFFVDVNLFKVNKEKAAELIRDGDSQLNIVPESSSSDKDGLADEDANLMVKLKFLTYKLRTFLIRNGLSILFKDGPSAYRTYYLRQMHNWGTSQKKQRELSKMLDEWATYITRKYGHKQLSSSTYLSEAEPFLERYAKRSPENQALIGAAGNLVSSENFLALIEGDKDEEGDLQRDQGAGPSSSKSPDSVTQDQGLIVFFPGIPGCAKSALCKEIINTPGGLGDNRPMHSLMGDLIKGRYWPLISDQLKKKPNTITLADKNAPNEEVWRQIEEMTQRFRVTAVPVVPDSEGTDTNPFSLDSLAVFIYRVLQRANHPGNLDKSSKNPGYVLLMFYHLYDGKSRRNFDSELYERFGSLVKMPVLKPDRDPLPDAVKDILEEGINLFRLHQNKHGRSEPSKGTYAREWSQWESSLRKILTDNANYINSIQVPFEQAVSSVVEQLKKVAKGEHRTPDTEKRRFGNIIFAAVTLPPGEIVNLLKELAEADPSAKNFLKDKELQNNLKKAHVTLAHKRSHGVAAVASYGIYLHQNVPVEFTALLFSDKAAALEARLGSVDGEKVISKNEWPHATIWTAPNVPPKEANTLPVLVSEGKATRLVIDPPIIMPGVLDFY
ncbi:RNA ligase isoform 1 [Rhynchospora pubera]|uniref:RNA ligase isoform 1 n=1 Tax=Rhynchospora pubera TaxID=906938 RepID=A0AAV8HAX8_9POAL|nr:RNA ligase isoform 1 [Rhynchospora pubera]